MVPWWWLRATLMLCGLLFIVVAQRYQRVLGPVDRMALTMVGWSLFLYVLYTTLRGR